ncbi:MAG: MFS transporter [Armatimonadetes bacterium]|nr:MFS transporter [Armatimonadota bacterium]
MGDLAVGLGSRLWSPAKRIMAVSLLVDLAVSCVVLGAQFLAIELGASPLVLGLIGTVGSLAYALSCVVSGTVSDRLGRKPLAVMACVVSAAVWLAMGRASNPYHLVALAPLSGAALAFFWPPAQAWLGELSGASPQRLNHNLSLFNIAWTTGIMTGPWVAGQTWEYGHVLPFVIGTALGLLGAAILLAIPARLANGPQPPAVSVSAPPRLVHLFLLLAWVGNWASWYARGTVSTLYPKLGLDLAHSHALVGTLILILGVAQLLAFALARFTVRWHYSLPILVAAEVLGLAGMAAGAWVHTPLWFAVAFSAIGICAGVTYVSSLTYALHGQASSRGKRSGLHEAVLGMGAVAGPLVGGVLGEAFGLRASFVAGAAAFAAAIVVQAVLFRREHAMGPIAPAVVAAPGAEDEAG